MRTSAFNANNFRVNKKPYLGQAGTCAFAYLNIESCLLQNDLIKEDGMIVLHIAIIWRKEEVERE